MNLMGHFTILDFLTLLCGITLFLYGMQLGEKNLKKLSKARLRQMIGAITKHRLTAYLTGFGTTLVTQSSSATTVMLVGLASVQLMTLRQSLGVILGSDLATTITVGLFAFKFYLIAPLLIAIGFVLSFSKKPGTSLTGKLILAVGFVFYGMHLMAQAADSLRTVPFVLDALNKSFTNPWVGILAGTLVTALIHSSAATLTIVIALAQNYTFPNGSTPGLGEFLPIVLGANIGTCATAFLAILQADADGVRVAWAHFSFKVIGTLIALPFVWLLSHFNVTVGWPCAFQIAALHTAFALYISAVFLPLLPLFDRAIRRLVVIKSAENQRFQTQFLHENVLSMPVLAISQAVKEISRMSEIVERMVAACFDLIKNYDYGRSKHIVDQDDEVDFLHEQILTFLTRIAREELGPEEAARSNELVMVTTDIEHIGDIASKSLTEFAEKIDASATQLSIEGKQEINELFETTIALLRQALASFTISDTGLARTIYDKKPQIKELFSTYVERHMARLYNQQKESLQTDAIHVDLLEEINRINHFTFRIAAHVLKIYRAE
jgi:phosphate:Na+ symporter